METNNIKENVSLTHLFDFINSTVKTLFVSAEEKFQWTNAEIARLIQIVARPILIIIGTIGNCLSFYIMRRTSLKDVPSCFYMSVLTLADTSKYRSILIL